MCRTAYAFVCAGLQLGTCSRFDPNHSSFGFDHINRNAPVLIRTPKLTRFEPAQYWGGGPPGNSVVLNPLFRLFFCFLFEWMISESISVVYATRAHVLLLTAPFVARVLGASPQLHVNAAVRMCAYVRMCACAYARVCAHVHMCACAYDCVCACMHARMTVCTCVYIRVRAHTQPHLLAASSQSHVHTCEPATITKKTANLTAGFEPGTYAGYHKKRKYP